MSTTLDDSRRPIESRLADIDVESKQPKGGLASLKEVADSIGMGPTQIRALMAKDRTGRSIVRRGSGYARKA